MLVDEKFKNWVMSLSQNYKKAQIKAAVHVNSELIKFYYELGKEIAKTSFKAEYGNRFYKTLSDELIKRNPNVKGLSQINIRYAERFYTLYKRFFHKLWNNCYWCLGVTTELSSTNVKRLKNVCFTSKRTVMW